MKRLLAAGAVAPTPSVKIVVEDYRYLQKALDPESIRSSIKEDLKTFRSKGALSSKD